MWYPSLSDNSYDLWVKYLKQRTSYSFRQYLQIDQFASLIQTLASADSIKQ